MPRVTALRPARPGRVLVELDGSDWRVIPVEAAARSGLTVGLQLDRPRLRALGRALRRAAALDAAGRALRRRDLSRHRLAHRLEARGVPRPIRDEALDALEQAGLVDDRRFAEARAESLAARGFGNLAIRVDLESQGIRGELVEQALESLATERERAASLAARLGRDPKAARALARRGFDEDAIDAAIGAVAEGP